MITIHFDFTDGTEISFTEGRSKGDNFTTHVLDFFNSDEKVDDVIVIKKNDEFISRKELLSNKGFPYTRKEILPTHNIHKMLIAGSFKFNDTKKVQRV